MVAEFSHMLDVMDESIVPVGTDGLKHQLRDTIHFRMPREGAVTAEWMDGEELRLEVGPMVEGLEQGEAYLKTSSWLHSFLPRRLNKWVKNLQKDSLPTCLSGLANLAGLDVESFLITGDDRGPCSICHNERCSKQMTAFMFHVKLASGVILISFEGWSKEELPKAVSPKCVPPRKTKCICPSQCEVRLNAGVVEAMRVLADMLWNESTSDLISVSFSAKKEERKQVNEVLEVLGIPPISIRVIEASLFDEESLANSQFVKYVDSEAGEPWDRLNCQVAWLHDGKSWPQECWANPNIQHSFSVDKINRLDREHVLYYVYNLVDEVGPLHLIWASVVKFVCGNPLLLLGGNDEFIAEFLNILLEVMTRATTVDGDYYRAKEALPVTVPEVFAVVESINSLPYDQRNAKLRKGAYALFNVNGGEFPFRSGPWFGSGPTVRRDGPASQPLVVAGKKSKSKGFHLNDGQVALNIGGTGIRQIVDQDMAIGMAGFEVGGGERGSITSARESRSDVDVPVRRERSRSQKSPSRKRHAADPERAEPQEVGDDQVNQVLKEIAEQFPEIEYMVNMAVKMGSISKENFGALMLELQGKLKHVAGDKHVDVKNHDVKKSAFANAPPAEDQDRIEKLENDIKNRAKDITALHDLQERDRKELKALRSKSDVYSETETGKRKRVREDKVENHKTRLTKALEAATKFVSFAKSKLNGSPEAILATVAIQNTLDRQQGFASSEPLPRVLDGYVHMETYDIIRSEVAMTSHVGDKIITSRAFQEAIKKFEDDKKHVGSGNLSGVGQALKELERIDSLGAASWRGTHIMMQFFRKMKKLRQRCHNEEVPGILPDSEIVSAKDTGAKKAANDDTRARILVDDLVMAFDDATVAVTGRGLLHTDLWYWDPGFQSYYNELLDEGIRVLKANGEATDDNGRKKFEAIVTSRQKPPLSETVIAKINSCFSIINSEIVVDEELCEEVSDMEEDIDTRPRKAAHLDHYD